MRGSVTDIDYKELLEKYIDHVGDCEGTDFTSNIWFQNDGLTSRHGSQVFTLEELTELRRLAGWK